MCSCKTMRSITEKNINIYRSNVEKKKNTNHRQQKKCVDNISKVYYGTNLMKQTYSACNELLGTEATKSELIKIF